MTPSTDAGFGQLCEMILTPDELSKIIALLARDEAAAVGGVALGYHAEQEISAVPRTYSPGDRIEVDLNRLRWTIKEVIKQAYLLNADVDAAAINQGLKRIKSRYLWF
jgi:hypothetical protein